MSVSLPSPSSEKIHEDSRYLRLLQQLGDYAVREMAFENPAFKKHNEGELGPNERVVIKEQADFMDPHIQKLAEVGLEEALAGNCERLAQALHQLTLPRMPSAGGLTIVHPATLGLLKALNELGARKNFFEIAGAVYALLKMAAAESLLFPAEHDTLNIRRATHSQVQVTGILPPEAGEILDSWEPPQGDKEPPHNAQTALLHELEQALESYASAYYPLRECIMPAIDRMIEAKKKFYRELASDFEENAGPSLKVSNLC